jgi:hypothetical protein
VYNPLDLTVGAEFLKDHAIELIAYITTKNNFRSILASNFIFFIRLTLANTNRVISS